MTDNMTDKEFMNILRMNIRHQDASGLEDTYKCLGDIVERGSIRMWGEAFKQLSEKALKLIKIGLQSKENDTASVIHAYETLREISEYQPELNEKILDLLVEKTPNMFHDADYELDNDRVYVHDVHDYQDEVRSARDVAYERHMQTLMRCLRKFGFLHNPDPEEKAAKMMFKFPYGGHDKQAYALRIHLMASYLRKHSLDDEVVKYSDNKLDIEVAQELRSSLPNDSDAYYKEFYQDRIVETRKKIETYYHTQQKAVDIMVRMRAREKGLPEAEGKKFRQLLNMVGERSAIGRLYANDKDWLIPASFKGVKVLGEYFPTYLKETEDRLSLQDAVKWLPSDMGEDKNASFSRFIQKNLLYQNAENKTVIRPLHELQTIAQKWENLTPEQEKGNFEDVLAVCREKSADKTSSQIVGKSTTRDR